MYRDHDQREFARSLRNQPTTAEKRLWHFLRAGQVRDCKIRRQAGGTIRSGWSSPYAVDFVCFSHKLIIELDGPQHLDREAIEHDTQRAAWLSNRGFHIVRFRNQELDENMRGVVDAMGRAIDEWERVPRVPPPQPSPPRGGSQSKIRWCVEGRGTNLDV